MSGGNVDFQFLFLGLINGGLQGSRVVVVDLAVGDGAIGGILEREDVTFDLRDTANELIASTEGDDVAGLPIALVEFHLKAAVQFLPVVGDALLGLPSATEVVAPPEAGLSGWFDVQ